MNKNVDFDNHPYNDIERIATILEKCCNGKGDGDDSGPAVARVGTAIVGTDITG